MQNDLTQELSTNFIEYAVAVNSDRAIPDAKSGLKPVAKRILWSTFEEGRTSSKPHVKSSRIVGDVMGRYHPHGDSSIYGAMVRLSQPWVMRYPLIDWHGNNGNIAGDGPAAPRYTEARLSKVAEDGLLYGIKKQNVNFVPNYDETLDEPVTLPAIFPNLLCNPNTGIGVAIACNWAPHNLNDVTRAINEYLKGEKISPVYPDFPTGGVIINKEDMPKIMETGHGSVKLRARYNIEKDKIIFYEIPYGETIEGLISQVGEACEKKEIEGVSDIHDESSKKIRIVVTCDKGIDPELVVKKLYAKTNFQTSFSYNQVALIDKTPTELNFKEAIKIYVDHNIECIVRECKFDLAKAEDRLEIVNGLLKALEDIDNIIALIKSSESAAAAKENLISRYNFTENQAKAILAMRLSSLAKLEKIELEKEAENLKEQINDLKKILANKSEQEDVLKLRLGNITKKYGDERKTEIAQVEETKDEKEKVDIVPEDVVVVITHGGDIKRVPKKTFKVQHRRGTGIKSVEKETLMALSTNTTETLMIFTSAGKMYRLGVDKIPEGNNVAKGTNIKTILPFAPGEEVQEISTLDNTAENVVFFTKNGLIKKTKFEEYSTMKKTTGIQAIKLKEGDSLINVVFMDNKEEVIMVTRKGMIIKVPTDDIKAIGRLTSGVKGIGLKDGDEVISAFPVLKDSSIAIVTKAGKGKRILASDVVIQNRGGRGVSCMKLDLGDEIAGAAALQTSTPLLLVGKPNSICISSEEIPVQTRAGSGTKMIERSTVSSLVVL
ncbi:MAG: DNA topoisomerase 4 subunit A [Clostridia bacterium]|nr:DNA topoisomerase 4 subunit A [Clostridia bacterium]